MLLQVKLQSTYSMHADMMSLICMHQRWSLCHSKGTYSSTNCTLWITRYIPQSYQENMTTLPSDTCSESLKTHKYDKKGQELIIGTLVMKITCTTCNKGTNYKYTKKKIFFKIFTT